VYIFYSSSSASLSSFVTTFIQGIYNYVPETKNVFEVHHVADILQLQFVTHANIFSMLNLLYFYIRIF
jgi:hypothetical protein